MAEYTPKDGELLDITLSHGLVFPDEFKDRVRDAILSGLRNVNYKQVPGVNAIRGRKLLQISGTVGVFNFTTAGAFVKMSASAPVSKTDVKISGIADGKYLIMFACQVSGGNGYAGLSINGDAPDVKQAVQAISIGSVMFGRMLIRTLKNDDNNTIELMARVDTATVFLDYPSISIMKIADQ